MSRTTSAHQGPDFLAGGGVTGEILRRFDWARTPIGSADRWPLPLKTLVRLMLSANQPMFIAWGPERTLLYNDDYAPMLADRHPSALGRPCLDVWHEVRGELTPLFDRVFAGQAVHMDDIELRLVRRGRLEEAHFAFSYSPIHDENGAVVGLFCPCTETTGRVLSDRRDAFMAHLSEALLGVTDARAAMATTVEMLGRHLKAQRVGYGRVQPDDATIVLESCFVDGVMPLTGPHSLDSFGAAVIARQRAGFTASCHDVALDPAQNAATWEAIETRAFASVPLVREGRFTASLYVNFREPHIWSPPEVALVEEVAARSWAAVERARVEADLRASQARLKAVFDAVPVGIIFAEAPSGRVTDGNAQAERMFGHPLLPSPDAEHHREWVSFHEDGRRVESHEYPLYRAIRGEAERPELEVIYQKAGGGRTWVRLIGAPVRGERGEITNAVVASLDIDRQKRAEADLRRLNETLEVQVAQRSAELDRVWRNSRDLLVLIGLDGVFRAINPAWTRILGHRPYEVVGHSFLDFVWPADADATRSSLDARASDTNPEGFESRHCHKDGTPRWISWQTSTEGDVVYAYGRDVTPEKLQAEQLGRAQDALRQAQKMEAVGQLTGGIAHDFNNMLAVVIGSLDLLGRRIGAGDDRTKRYVDAAADGARRAALLTQRLLAFSRQQPLKPEAIDVNKLVTGMSELIRGAMGSGIRLETVLAARGWRIHADPNQLENVILNLAVNARDAMLEGGQLTIETQNAPIDDCHVAANLGVPAGQYVLLAVSDTGSGMPAEVLAKAFDPFFTTKEVGKGTGLGLSQVYGFVKQSGGHVKIYSEPGQGTAVKVYLPRLTGQENGTVCDSGSSDVSHGRGQEVILLVEDEPAVRRFSANALAELGYRVLEADGAAAALRLLEVHPDIALMFIDVVTPASNGSKLADEARRRRPGLKVLFTTGYTSNAVVHNGVLDQGVELIDEPFTIEALAAKLRELLDRPPSALSG